MRYKGVFVDVFNEFGDDYTYACDQSLSRALWEAQEGNLSDLTDLLRSEPHFSHAGWTDLADFIEGKMTRGRGRPRKSGMVQPSLFDPAPLSESKRIELAANDFRRIKRVWRERYGRKYRIRDKAITLAAKRRGVSFDSLAGYLRRGKPAQNNR